MKIAILGSRGIPNRYGGFEEMAAQVAPLWASAGHEVWVYTVSNHPEKVRMYRGVRVVHIFNPEPALGLSGQFVYDLLCTLHARRKGFDVYLQLGYTTSALWSFLWPKQKTWTNMDGLEHQRAKYAGILSRFLRWSERRAAQRSKVLVADNPGIADYLQRYPAPIVTIAYGTAVLDTAPDASLLEQFELEPFQFSVHIGRVQPDNHVEEILQAAVNSGTRLVAVGDYTTPYGKQLFQKFKSFPQLLFTGPLYDKQVLNALRYYGNYYLHGHSAGGTNPALLEALGCGAWVLAHNNPFNASVLEGLGGLWTTVQELEGLLGGQVERGMRQEQARAAKEHMRLHYRWESVASAYLAAFEH